MTAAVLLLALVVTGDGAPPPATRVGVEVFAVALTGGTGETVAYARGVGELERGVNPDDRAREIAASLAGAVALIHSTSWRWEPDGRIVLTYVAWAKEGALGAGARPLPPLAPPGPTDPLHPRPVTIRELDPLAHGLRHLAFLLRTSGNGALATAIGPRSAAALAKLEPAVAGELAPP